MVVLVVTYPSMTVEDCNEKCDSIFNLLNVDNERISDHVCGHYCNE